jgi:Protein kinase domain/PEGA domain
LGPVFRAYQPEQDRLVAVKLFRLDLDPERVQRFVSELERLIAADLTHPAIAAPIAAGVAGVSPYLAQDFVADESLDTFLRVQSPAAPADVLRVATAIGGALDFAAAARIQHGALHPRDVLVSSDDVRMTGLGVARALERVGVNVPIRRPYTAPERGGGRAWDRRADVFSLAVLTHEMLWGRRPSAVGERAATELADVPGADMPALRDTFARALAERFGDRYESALAFVEALKAGLPSLAPVTAQVEPVRPVVIEISGMDTDKIEPFFPELPLDETEAPAPAVPARVMPDPPAAGPAAPVAVTDRAVEGRSEPVEWRSEAVERRSESVERGPESVERRSVQRPAPPRPAASERRATFRNGRQATEAPVARPDPPLLRDHDLGPPTHVDVAMPITALDSTRSAVWPLVLALGVGLALGFAWGYGVGGRTGSETIPAQMSETPVQPGPAPAASTPPADSAAAESAVPLAPAPSAAPDATAAAAPAATGGDPLQTTEPPRQRPAARPSPAASSQVPPAAPPRRRPVAPPAATRTAPPPPAATPTGPTLLIVESRPAGASVFLDGKPIGATPLALEGVSAGEHAIHLELPGYNRWASAVRIVSGARNRVAASLER